MNPVTLPAAALATFCIATPAFAAEGLDGASLGFLWAVPFLGMLLSIAIMPLVAYHFWEHNRGKVAAFWAALTLIPISPIPFYWRSGLAWPASSAQPGPR